MVKKDTLMKIGEVAKKTGVSMRTIRYYEELKMIAPTSRSKGGFRLYDREATDRVHLILSLQTLDLSLKEIKTLLSLRDKKKTRGEVAKILLSKLTTQFVEAERKKAIYQAIVQDFDEGIRILMDCQECKSKTNMPHCGKHKIFRSADLLPRIIRSLF
ncbi:MAG: MerR family transcriptional regulator [Proteobacteria bacterium]|nr:MerR family transcriptional regulator [Pseudomonadota bacterium]